MQEHERRGQRLVALCMLGCVLFNYPMLALFNVPATRVRRAGAVRLHLRRLGGC